MAKQRQFGFTLIELLVTLVVASVLATLAVPAYQGLIRDTRFTTQINDFVAALHYARSEAVKRGSNVNLDALSVTTNWTSGWRAYADTDADGVQDVGETDIRRGDALSAPLSLTAGPAGTTSVRYRPTGTITSVNPITFDLCDSNVAGETGRRITIAAIGRISIADFTCL